MYCSIRYRSPVSIIGTEIDRHDLDRGSMMNRLNKCLQDIQFQEKQKKTKLVSVGCFERKEVSQLNNDLFLVAKDIMKKGTEGSKRGSSIGWASVGDYIDWLEQNYDIKPK